MKAQIPTNIEKLRVKSGPLGSTVDAGNNGAFHIPYADKTLYVIISDGMGWDHISVSTTYRCPTWEEMNFIKNLFFDSWETVVQFHPRHDQYVNCCDTCLHMWKKQGHEYQLPPKNMLA